MSENSITEVRFTEILYSVVIANALTKLTFGLSLRNGMVFLAVLVILSDWVEYSAFLTEVGQSTSTVRIFVADMLVLFVWNTLTIIPEDQFVWYVIIMAVFFATQHVWELVSGRFRLLELVAKPTTGLVVGYVAIAAATHSGMVRPVVGFAICAVLFVVGKIPAWRQIQRMDSPIAL